MKKVPIAWSEYVKQLDAAKQKALLDTMDMALGMINDPECVMSYGVPTIKSNDTYIIAAGAYKNFLSLYPFGNDAIEANQPLFAHNDKSKGAVRFSYSLLPKTEQIKAIVQFNSDKQ
ncbi:protein containing DUF1801 [sediment metagenome]|uniref:Protein containing DUF1801 n=1 Tax=sediment metagenome TaxID=749907 RepID=D9PLA7_9ZZZZ